MDGGALGGECFAKAVKYIYVSFRCQGAGPEIAPNNAYFFRHTMKSQHHCGFDGRPLSLGLARVSMEPHGSDRSAICGQPGLYPVHSG